jgi:hypothetical protein
MSNSIIDLCLHFNLGFQDRSCLKFQLLQYLAYRGFSTLLDYLLSAFHKENNLEFYAKTLKGLIHVTEFH